MPFFNQQADAFASAVEQMQSDKPTTSQFDASESEAETLSEVEVRLVKANYYRAILDQPLFGDDESDIAYDVEREFRDFALERLRILLGMQLEKAPEEKAFSSDQEEVLKEWADRLIARPQLLGVVASGQPQVQPAQVRPAAPAVQTTKPQVNQVAAQTPRKRGRPPGSGKNQRTQTRQPDSQSQPVAQLSKDELAAGVKVDEKGKYFEQQGQDAVTGQPKLIKMYLTTQSTPVNDPSYKPMPPPDSDIALMREQAEANMMQSKAVNLHPKMGQILNHFLTGE